MKINNHNNMADATLPFSDSCSGIVSCLEYGPHYQLSTLLALGTSDNRLCIKQSTVNVSLVDRNILTHVHLQQCIVC